MKINRTNLKVIRVRHLMLMLLWLTCMASVDVIAPATGAFFFIASYLAWLPVQLDK